MRLKIHLTAGKEATLPVNYNYALSAALYNLLKFGTPEFSEFLLKKGLIMDQKIYKLFCFSLRPEKSTIVDNKIVIKSKNIYLYLSTPLVEDFVTTFISEGLQRKKLVVCADNQKSVMNIEKVEVLSEPKLKEKTKFLLLNPLVLSTRREIDGRIKQHFLRYDEDNEKINRILNANLSSKYNLLHNKMYSGPGVKLSWDQTYIERQLLKGKRISKKVAITKDPANPINIIGIHAPFLLQGDPSLMEAGYKCGFGEKNSMGFGMAEVV